MRKVRMDDGITGKSQYTTYGTSLLPEEALCHITEGPFSTTKNFLISLLSVLFCLYAGNRMFVRHITLIQSELADSGNKMQCDKYDRPPCQPCHDLGRNCTAMTNRFPCAECITAAFPEYCKLKFRPANRALATRELEELRIREERTLEANQVNNPQTNTSQHHGSGHQQPGPAS
ncbi:hypothetical protein GE09DRAFT_600302 [Coniochaeta sp. 2T2.1]|nr:hypothetical protein GE09DRAFT_600302 [Coniochaeta sp. 2T2.1]